MWTQQQQQPEKEQPEQKSQNQVEQKKPQKQVQQNTQQDPLTPEIIEQLLELLSDQKIEVRHGSLNAILQYTKTQASKLKFKKTNLFELIFKNLLVEQLTKICLSTLIHFSSLEEFSDKMIIFIPPLVVFLKQWTDLRQQLALLFLLNVTKYQPVVESLSKSEKEGKPNDELEAMIGFIETKPTRKWVIVNIFVNITSLQVGRKHVCQHKLYLRFIKQLEAYIQSTRVGALKLFRNCSFEWENQQFIQEFLKPEHDIINKMAEFLISMIIVGNLSPNTPQEELHKILKCYLGDRTVKDKQLSFIEISSKEKALGEVVLALDVILILSNSGFAQRKPKINAEPLKEIIKLLKGSDLEQEYKDKLEAMEIFCFH